MEAGADFKQCADAAAGADCADGGAGNLGEELEEGTLAGSVLADDSHHVALLNLEVYIPQGPDVIAAAGLCAVVGLADLQVWVFLFEDGGLPPPVEVVTEGLGGYKAQPILFSYVVEFYCCCHIILLVCLPNVLFTFFKFYRFACFLELSSYIVSPKQTTMKRIDLNQPVTVLSGNEFLPVEGRTFAEQVLGYFQSQGGVAHSPWGPVLLDKKGVQSDKSHGVGRIKACSFAAIKDVLEKGEIILPLDYYATSGKKQLTGMMAAPILIGTDSFICVVVVMFNLKEKRLYLHETFLTEKIPEIAASSLVRGSGAASPQSRGSIAKILTEWFISK